MLRRATERRARLTDRATDSDGVVRTANEFDKRLLPASLPEAATHLAAVAAHRATRPA